MEHGRRRVVIEGVEPEIDGGRFPIKRIVGDRVIVEADVFADGHDLVACALRHRHEDDADWTETPMRALVNDRCRGGFAVARLGRYRYTLVGWIDRFGSWARDLEKRVAARQDVTGDLEIGARLVEDAARRASGADAARLLEEARSLRDPASGATRALAPELRALVARYEDRSHATAYERELEVVVDRERARFATWYELFPRSTAPEPARHGTFADVVHLLPEIAAMGFDVLYLPPIHPIGRSFRKGRAGALAAASEDPGSPWAIGGPEGGHTAVHPELGTLDDFRALVAEARRHGIEVALDLAYQASPDHPWLREHPDWFRRRPDGTVQYAENPPKKYQDILPFDLESERWHELWEALCDVVRFWIAQGARIFRVDNPHTKPFLFWEWLIAEIKRVDPDVIFLSEAFTRPKVMYRLAKLGFTQSYTYFAWRSTKWELTQYFTELTTPLVREFFRPSLWPNTPDILTEYLQTGGRPAFFVRLVLAATLGASYGIYGPAFELLEDRAIEPGKEEYLDSEKYRVRHWDRDRAGNLKDVIARVNRARREHPALQRDDTLRFHETDNEQLLAYTKASEDGADLVLALVNLDPRWPQSGWLTLPLDELGIDPAHPFEVDDLLTGARYLWHGPRNYVELDPRSVPAHVFAVRPRLRTERDFEYYL